MGWTDISPTTDQRSAIGTGIKLIHDPWNFRRYILFGSQGGLMCDDITVSSPVWRSIKLSASTVSTHCSLTLILNVGTLTKTDCHYRFKSASSGGNQVLDFENADTGVNFAFDVFDLHGVSFDSSAYYNGSGDPHNNVGIVSPLYRLILELNGSTEFFVDADSAADISVSTNDTFIADISGSINRQGQFYWLSKRTISGTDYVYLNRTSNYFQTVKSTQIAHYVTGMNYGINCSSYDANVLYVTAGDPGASDAKVYLSTNGGSSFSATSVTLTTTGGGISVPYNGVASGANTANAGSTPYYMCIKGQSGGNTKFHAIDASSTNVFTSNKNVPHFGLTGSTIGGLSINAMSDDAILRTSDDGGLTFSTASGTVPAGGTVHGINGMPTTPDAILAFGDQTLCGSDDRGATWGDFYGSNYDTFRSSAYGSGGTNIVWSQIRLDRLYDQSVTT